MAKFLVIDEPSDFAPLEVLQQWLFDMDARIAETADPEQRRFWEQSRAGVLETYRQRVAVERRSSGRIQDSDPAQFGKP